MENKELFYGFTEADLDGYVRKTLSKETQQAMDLAIQKHAALKAELIKRIQLYRLLLNPEGFIWLDQFKKRSKRTFIQRAQQSFGFKMALGVSLVALLTGGFWFQKKTADARNQWTAQRVEWIQQALAENPDRNVYSNNTANGALNQAIEYYGNQQYEKAEPLFAQYLTAAQDEEIQVNIAVCRLRTGQFKAARRILEEAKSGESSDVQSAIRWYLSLALATENRAEATEMIQKYLSEIAERSDFKTSAEAFAKRIKE